MRQILLNAKIQFTCDRLKNTLNVNILMSMHYNDYITRESIVVFESRNHVLGRSYWLAVSTLARLVSLCMPLFKYIPMNGAQIMSLTSFIFQQKHALRQIYLKQRYNLHWLGISTVYELSINRYSLI